MQCTKDDHTNKKYFSIFFIATLPGRFKLNMKTKTKKMTALHKFRGTALLYSPLKILVFYVTILRSSTVPIRKFLDYFLNYTFAFITKRK